MPRKSAESLLSPVPALSTPRMNPPAHLNKHELAIWVEITRTLPSDWFVPADSALLERYVTHLVRARNLETLIVGTDPVREGKQWERLTRMAAAESKLVIALARSMRLSPRARTHPQTARNHARGVPVTTVIDWSEE